METSTQRSEALSKFKTQPYRHQLECLNKFGRQHSFALLAEMGTGKTWIVINNIADLWSSDDCDAVLVLAPNGVHTNWTRLELPKHMPDWVRYRSAAWVSAPNKREKEELDNLYAAPSSGELRILTMNHEALQTKRGYEFAEKFCMTGRRVMIVADESDAYKNPKAARTKALMKLRRLSYWRRIMSGTPINNAPFDAFSQFSFLDEHILGTTSFFAFKAEYAEMLQQGNPLLEAIKKRSGSRFTPQVVAKGVGGRPKYRNLDKLSRLIAPHSFRVLKKDCLDLPEKIYKTLVFSMTREQIEVYKKAEQECRLVFANEETPFNKLVAVTKLAQITSGYYIHPLSEEPVRIEGDNPKLDLLIERVQKIVESGEKVIIWARYRIEIEDIVARLRADGIESVEYHGGIKKDERTEAIESFERGSASAFVGNQQAGGTGITLVAASYVIYFSNNFSLRDRLQSEDRAHRIGQKKNVTYINIAAKGTIDEVVIKALSSKKDVADTIIDRGLALFG
jgi:SNF2 family DNA or RNA helicase